MNYTTKKIIFFLLTIVYYSSYSQNSIKGKVIDKENGVPISNVSVSNLNNNTKSLSDGYFEINQTGIYKFSKKGYLKYEVNLKNKNFYIIELIKEVSLLDEVTINANYLPKPIKEASSSIHIISTKDIKRGNNINISEVLNRTPGVFMQSGALNTNRITIRGIGARNLFGTAKIRAYFKDIPITTGSGETNIEDFELGSISRLEITKGSSSIYGAGLGGSIQLIPEKGSFNTSNFNTEFSLGSFGLIKNVSKLNYGNNKNNYKAIHSSTHSDGYRDNNQYDRQTFTLNTNHFINNKNNISILASYVDLKAFIPSSLNENNYINNPKSASFTWNAAKGFEDVQRGFLGLSWQHIYNKKLKQSTSIFSSFKNSYEPRPFNILNEKTFAYGFRTRLIGNTSLVEKALSWSIGIETFKDQHKWGTFQNLYEDYPAGHGSVKGDQLSNFKEKRNYFNLFFETNYKITSITILSLGLNYNKTSYNLSDRFTILDSNLNQSGDFKFEGILSPKFGITQNLSKTINLYSNVSHGFSPLSLEETLLPDGQINTTLKPETGWNLELGARGSLINNRLQLHTSIFSLNVKNLLVARRTSEDQFIGLNAGKTRHNGLEFDIKYNWLTKMGLTINTSINYTQNNFIFKEFIDAVNDYSGNDLTGVPSNIFNAIIDIDSNIGIYGNINFQYVGSMPITDSNSLYSSNYNITNAKIGYKTNLSKKLNLNTFLGLNNIFDKAYASQILINASSFGGRAPRYYYPGNPVNYYAGININYNF